ncbi:MAG: hypothetical protein MK240_08725 [Opitutales bacterium]|nr:hypothetical protein [Opitutales bacterium]
MFEEQVVNAAETLVRMQNLHGFEQSYLSAKIWGLGFVYFAALVAAI